MPIDFAIIDRIVRPPVRPFWKAPDMMHVSELNPAYIVQRVEDHEWIHLIPDDVPLWAPSAWNILLDEPRGAAFPPNLHTGIFVMPPGVPHVTPNHLLRSPILIHDLRDVGVMMRVHVVMSVYDCIMLEFGFQHRRPRSSAFPFIRPDSHLPSVGMTLRQLAILMIAQYQVVEDAGAAGADAGAAARPVVAVIAGAEMDAGLDDAHINV